MNFWIQVLIGGIGAAIIGAISGYLNSGRRRIK
jgi:hypothetical protein